MLELLSSLASPWAIIPVLTAVIAVIVHLYFTWGLNIFESQGVAQCNLPWYTRVFGLLKMTFHDFDDLVYRNCGKPQKYWGLYNGRTPTFYVRDPELAKEIMIKDFAVYMDRQPPGTFKLTGKQAFMNRMVSTVTGDEWKNTRSVMTPAFSTGKLKMMVEMMMKSTSTMSGNFKTKLMTNDEIDMKEMFRALTVDIIATCAFGIEINSTQEEDHPFTQYSKTVIDRPANLSLIMILFLPKIAKFFRLTFFPDDVTDYFRNLSEEVVAMRRKDPEKHKRCDFLTLLLESEIEAEKKEEVTNGPSNNGNAVKSEVESKRNSVIPRKQVLDEEAILAQAFLFFFAGSDTIATTITMATYLLAKNPECQAKALEEIDTVFEQIKGELNYDHLHKFQYMDQVVNETIRIFPPAERVMRVPNVDTTIDGVKIPKNCFVVFPVWLLHHDPEFHPDPEKFKPERFAPENKAKMNPFTYIPFGMGPRNCIANRFALLEVKIALIQFFRHFRVEPCEKTVDEIKFNTNFGILSPKNIILRVIKR